jgi:hypothetical protein
MRPTLIDTRLYNTRPDAVVTLTVVPMASWPLDRPVNASTSQ